MAELIERQAVIDAANRTDYMGLTVEDVTNVTDAVVAEIKKLPSALTPCSVRLPVEAGDYLVQTDLGGFMVISYWNGLWNASEYGTEFAFENDKIVAWMPLPEPWKGEQDEQT